MTEPTNPPAVTPPAASPAAPADAALTALLARLEQRGPGALDDATRALLKSFEGTLATVLENSNALKARAEADAKARKEAEDAATAAAAASATADALTKAAEAAAAIDAGDLLKLLDPEAIKRDAKGAVTNAAELIADLKKAKPHLFKAAGTSAAAAAPKPGDPPPKKARDMNDDEYKAALGRLGIQTSRRRSY